MYTSFGMTLVAPFAITFPKDKTVGSTRNDERGITSSVHTPTFDIDETALACSTGLMAYLAVKRLGN